MVRSGKGDPVSSLPVRRRKLKPGWLGTGLPTGAIPALLVLVWVVGAGSGPAQASPASHLHQMPGDLPGDTVLQEWEDSTCRTAPGPCLEAVLAEVAATHEPGAVILVTTDEGSWTRARGLASLEHGLPLGPETAFDAASMAKQFTALAVALLEERGLLDLDDEVRAHLPEFPHHDPPVRIGHLLNHTSGVRDWPGLLLLAGWRFEDLISHQLILRVTFGQSDLNFPAGTRTTYSNTGYVLLAEIVTRRTGVSFPEFMRREIFEPLGMYGSWVPSDPGDVIPGRAGSYRPTPDGIRRVPSNLSAWGSSSLFTTAEDLQRWVAFLQGVAGEEELHRAARRLAEERVGRGGAPRYGWGQIVDELRGHRVLRHGGAWAGYRSALVRMPDEGIAVAVLANRSDVDADAVAERVLAALLAPDPDTPLDLLRDAPPAAAADGAEEGTEGTEATGPDPHPGMAVQVDGSDEAPSVIELNEYQGEYRNVELESTFTLTAVGEALLATHLRLGHHWVEPLAPDHFRSVVFGEVRFERDSEGRVTGFEVHQPRNRHIRFRRIAP